MTENAETTSPDVPLYASDMDDSAEIVLLKDNASAHRLLSLLIHCAHVIEPSFKKADGEVSRRRDLYLSFARWAAWLGASAVLFAIGQLSNLTSNNWVERRMFPTLEFSLAAAAVLVALVGLGGTVQEKWFVARYRAERLRHLKFDFLLRPVLWSGDEEAAEDCRQGLDAEVKMIVASEFANVESWMLQGTVPQVAAAARLPEEEWTVFRDYYRNKRLAGQIDYLAGAKERNSELNNRSRTWPTVLFFGSIAFVLAHFCVDLVNWRTGSGPDDLVGKVALMVAAGLPVCGAGIRVFRGVFEYGRNAARSTATHGVLLDLSERLRRANGSSEVFREISFCEQVMEADLREYLRLMVSAEWFG
jgi:hypothetical protein